MIDRILIVGLGSIGKRHLRLAREILPHAEISVLRHKIDPFVPEFANRTFSTMEEALAFAPQIAVIASPATHHLSTASLLAEAGVHLLIEKPLSATIEGAAELIDICRKKNIRLATGYNLRFLPSLQKFRSILNEGLIGAIWSVRCECGQYLPSWRAGADYRNGVSARLEMGGGVLLELSHEIDYLRWIFGEIEWVQCVLEKQSDLEVDVEDSAHLIMGFSSKPDQKNIVTTLNLDFIRQDTTRVCTAIGKLGSLRWNAAAGTVELFSSNSLVWQEVYRHQHSRDESYLAQLRNFIQCVEQKSSPLVTGADGMEVLRIIGIARLASETGRRVSVDRLLQSHK